VRNEVNQRMQVPNSSDDLFRPGDAEKPIVACFMDCRHGEHCQ
jgi:hypothetical protein